MTASDAYVGLSGIATFFSGIMFAWLRSDVKKVSDKMEILTGEFTLLERKVSSVCGYLKGKGILQ